MKCTTIITLYCSTLFLSFATAAIAIDVIRANETIRDGDSILSARREFELVFFSPDNSTKRYLGIWYKENSIRDSCMTMGFILVTGHEGHQDVNACEDSLHNSKTSGTQLIGQMGGKKKLDCGTEEGFQKFSGVKLPDT
ncbi:hypothetical protein POM88_036527 [Heracleum sosnowskyi]|uniref:Uncharacterized protein n=1 Tax=Heracleum sosnowskyi TaxID=360622 RepID=A0AAD8HQT7_9APIA|nr:hypothetical protein POM88_036527 [Heracleum sosnowskyi]